MQRFCYYLLTALLRNGVTDSNDNRTASQKHTKPNILNTLIILQLWMSHHKTISCYTPLNNCQLLRHASTPISQFFIVLSPNNPYQYHHTLGLLSVYPTMLYLPQILFLLVISKNNHINPLSHYLAVDKAFVFFPACKQCVFYYVTCSLICAF